MSFEIANFSPLGGQARSGNSPAHWSYESTTDDLAAAQATGYFDKMGTQVSPGDFISTSLTDGKAILTVASTVLSPPGVVIDLETIGSGSGGSTFPVETFTGNLFELVVADNLKFFIVDSLSTAATVVVPLNFQEPFPIGAEMEFVRKASASVVFGAMIGATLLSRNRSRNMRTIKSVAILKKIDTDTWCLFGDLSFTS